MASTTDKSDFIARRQSLLKARGNALIQYLGRMLSEDGEPRPGDRVKYILSLASRLRTRDMRAGSPLRPLYQYILIVLRASGAYMTAETLAWNLVASLHGVRHLEQAA